MEYYSIINIVLAYLAVINVVTFFMYGIDKWKAKRSKWRIPEATLLLMAVLGGSLGAWLGMKLWHHKTLHKKFRYGIPLILVAQIALIALTSCKSQQAVDNTTQQVTFGVAKNYFFKNGQTIPANPKITTEEEFRKLFGMATTMGKDGKPTEIDFTRQFALAIVLPATDIDTEISPVQVKAKGDSLFYTYDVHIGEKQSFTTKPLSIIILDKKYENSEVILIPTIISAR